jgi:2-polyprenyl-3-methyl-5-hydroxy-6-metoxy-1,4-benzoquinol methylase
MQTISTMAALDKKLAECDAACRVSDDALRQVFTTFRMDFSTKVPADPFSLEYHEFQMAVYERIAGKKYAPRNEVSVFDAAAADRRPFPYHTRNCSTAGHFTMGVGFLLHMLDLPAGARVVEFGPGWGNTTIAMAMTGLDVTAVDIEPNFCDLLRLRATRHDVGVTVVNADFMWAETVSEPFDAAIFFECFHHCSDHMRLLRALQRAVKPNGRVYFAAEPIVPDFPLPWGLRMDGESLWAIRSNGWMELGYRESYFREALARTGWTATRHALPGMEWASVWKAKRIDEAVMPGATRLPGGLAASTELRDPVLIERDAAIAARDAALAERDALLRSSSWKITAPLRSLSAIFRAR